MVGRGVTIKAEHARQTQINYGGSSYNIEGKYMSRAAAYKHVLNLRTNRGSIYPNHYTKAIVVDLGYYAGTLRFGVFVAEGRKKA